MKAKLSKICKFSLYTISGTAVSIIGIHILTSYYYKALCRSNLKKVINSELVNKYPQWKERLVRFLLKYNLFPEMEYEKIKGVEIFDRHFDLPFGVSANLDYSSDVSKEIITIITNLISKM